MNLGSKNIYGSLLSKRNQIGKHSPRKKELIITTYLKTTQLKLQFDMPHDVLKTAYAILKFNDTVRIA